MDNRGLELVGYSADMQMGYFHWEGVQESYCMRCDTHTVAKKGYGDGPTWRCCPCCDDSYPNPAEYQKVVAKWEEIHKEVAERLFGKRE